MKSVFSLIVLSLSAVSLLTATPIDSEQKLVRRKSFIETHQEHGHLPGGKNNPGYGALLGQVMSILGGKAPQDVLHDFNEKADAENGKSGTEKASKSGMMSALGLGDIPLVGGLL